jgi:hypothetical protein
MPKMISATKNATLIGFQVHFLVLHTAPQPLDEDIVDPAALAVHADLDAMRFEGAGELFADELAALIGVEDLGCAVVLNRLLLCA